MFKLLDNKAIKRPGKGNPVLYVLQDLSETKVKLEEEIKVKANSLKIDQQRCMATRRTFPYNIITTRYY